MNYIYIKINIPELYYSIYITGMCRWKLTCRNCRPCYPFPLFRTFFVYVLILTLFVFQLNGRLHEYTKLGYNERDKLLYGRGSKKQRDKLSNPAPSTLYGSYAEKHDVDVVFRTVVVVDVAFFHVAKSY